MFDAFKLSLNIARSIDDKTKRTILTYTPVLSAKLVARGELRFACWQVWEDDVFTARELAISNAMANARKVLGELTNV